jgi:GT2 family glycosyltransferase
VNRQVDVIIPSKNFSNVRRCLEALYAAQAATNSKEPGSADTRVIVVDDGIDWNRDADAGPVQILSQPGTELHIVAGEKPFVFARNVNVGIEASRKGSYIAILNDDALLECNDGLWRMARAMYDSTAHLSPFGVVSAVTNLAGNPAQHRHTPGVGKYQIRPVGLIPGHTAPVVAFVCAMISPTCLRTVGLLDERFDKYGFDDNDYCRRAVLNGFRVGVFDDCYVDHSRLQPTFRKAAAAAGDIGPAMKIYIEKWGRL